MIVRSLAIGLIFVPMIAAAVDLPVTYSADFNTFKRNVDAGDTLQFELHIDAGCTAAVHTENIAASAPALVVEKVARQKVKGQSPRPPRIMRLSTVLNPATIEERFFLKAVGTGIQGIPGDCQPLAPAPAAPGPLRVETTGMFTRLASEGTGNQSVGGIGFQPSAVVVFCSTFGVGNLGASVGAADEFQNEIRLQISETDGTTVGGGRVVSVIPDGVNGMEAEVFSYDPNGFTLNWATVSAGVDLRCFAMCFK